MMAEILGGSCLYYEKYARTICKVGPKYCQITQITTFQAVSWQVSKLIILDESLMRSLCKDSNKKPGVTCLLIVTK